MLKDPLSLLQKSDQRCEKMKGACGDNERERELRDESFQGKDCLVLLDGHICILYTRGKEEKRGFICH